MDEFSLKEPSSNSIVQMDSSKAISSPNNNNRIEPQSVKTEQLLQAKGFRLDGLIQHKRQLVPYKDFTFEVRALRDIEQFAHQAELILDVNEVNIYNIVERMISKVSSKPSCVVQVNTAKMRALSKAISIYYMTGCRSEP